ncbi:MAG TPA: DUF5667 domain-containing protein [Pseudonocardiaceae bacterium]|nr:DUF5667 domain-containing protein [Pseudonocardiaceae bacterium]
MAGGRPWWRQRERFARAVEASAHDTEPYDPKLAGELAVVMMLRRSADATAPEGAARDRMRAKVLGELAVPPPMKPSPVPRAAVHKPGRVTGTRGRLVIALGAAFCLVLALSGMTLLLSRNALPGDPLYAVRRTVESATLGLTSGDDAKGRKHIEFAADRVGDIETLAGRYPDPADSPVGDYLTAFADFDSDASAGTANLTGYATDHGPGDLTLLRTWATQQAGRIQRVEPKLPAQARTRAAQSVTLLTRIGQRAAGLLARDACYTVTSGATDDLGVLPATGPCDQAPGVPPQHAVGGQPAGANSLPAQVPGKAGATGPNTTPTSANAQPVLPTTFAVPPVVPPPVLTKPPLAPPTTTDPPTLTLPIPIPGLNIPALLPGLPALRIGG